MLDRDVETIVHKEKVIYGHSFRFIRGGSWLLAIFRRAFSYRQRWGLDMAQCAIYGHLIAATAMTLSISHVKVIHRYCKHVFFYTDKRVASAIGEFFVLYTVS